MVQLSSKWRTSVAIDGVFIAVIVTLFRWALGIIVSIVAGTILARLHFPAPENPMVAAWIAWTIYCAVIFVRAFMRIARSMAR